MKHPLLFVLLALAQFCQAQVKTYDYPEGKEGLTPMNDFTVKTDTFVPTEMVYRLYEAKRTGHKELWITPGTTHARSYHDHPSHYLRKVKNFIQTIAKLSPLRD